MKKLVLFVSVVVAMLATTMAHGVIVGKPVRRTAATYSSRNHQSRPIYAPHYTARIQYRQTYPAYRRYRQSYYHGYPRYYYRPPSYYPRYYGYYQPTPVYYAPAYYPSYFNLGYNGYDWWGNISIWW